MATIKFLIQSDKEKVQIYVRLSIGRGKYFKRKVGLTIGSRDWNKEKGMPKPNSTGNKKLASDLRGLDKFLYDQINDASSSGLQITGDWLSNQIDIHFERIETMELDKLTAFCDNYINSMHKNGKAINTIKKYNTTLNKLIEFEFATNRTYLVKDVNVNFSEEFINFLREDCRYQDNTASRVVGYLKTMCSNAEIKGVQVSPQLKRVKGLPKIKMPFVYLNFDEIKKINTTSYDDPIHEVVADWLIVSCYTGQRISDLLRMNKDMIVKLQGFDFISLTQMKTKNMVHIPIDNNIKEILEKYNGQFPPRISKADQSNMVLYNRLLKKVCKKAGINALVKGNLYSKQTERMEIGMYPKYKLISSHVGRRSYASNFFGKIPTPLLMNITAHSTESMFMKYIHKTSSDKSVELARILESWNN